MSSYKMTENDVVKILMILSAYYGKPKADADDMVGAWWLILRDYDYIVVEQACIEYAKNDRREYSQFPTIGNILGSIEEEEGAITRIRNWALDKKSYEELGPRSQKWISEERYEKLKACGFDYLIDNLPAIKKALKNDLLMLEEKI